MNRSLVQRNGWLLSGLLVVGIMTAASAVDTDGDGLPDLYEDSNTNNIVDPGETDPLDDDSDDDGYGDGIELTQGSDPLLAASVPAHHDPSGVACFDDRPQDQTYFAAAPLQHLRLRQKIDGHIPDSEDDRLVVAQGFDARIILDPNNLQISGLGPVGDTITGMSPIVRTDTADDAVFLVVRSGVVERWDTEEMTGALSTPRWSRSLRRCSSDTLTAAPLIQLRQFSSAAFKANFAFDLVYVGTRYVGTCGGSDPDKDNNIYALNGTTGAIAWIFNAGDTHDMDIVFGLAQENDTLFVASDRKNAAQDSLWAIDVLTGTNLWSANAGSLRTTPLLMDGRVYVSTIAGSIRAYDQATGTSLWSVSNPGVPFVADSRIIKTSAGDVLIASVDIDGDVWLVRDETLYASEVWSITLPGTTASGPLVAGLGGENLFVGGNNGRIYQIDLATGAVEASRLAAAGEAITDLALQEDDFTSRVPSLFATTDGGRLLRFSVPFRTNTYPLDTDGDGVTDGVDNAPAVANPGQADSDQDGIGDVIDPPNPERAQAAYLLWSGGDTNDPNAQFDADLNSNGILNGIEFFMGSSVLTPASVVENTVEYGTVAFSRDPLAFDTAYQVNYSFDLVDWHVAQPGVSGVVLNVDGGSQIKVWVPTGGTNTFFSTLTIGLDPL